MLPTAVGALVRKRLPVTQWFLKYSSRDAVCDVIAGITVGLTLMPQAIAYAGLAGLGPQYGLYSSWVGSLVYIVFGTTKQISLGPTALLSLLTFTYTHHLNADMAVFLCFMSGCVELICGLLQLGFLVDFVSVPVVSGFTSAAALTIASAQLKGLFGLRYSAESFLDTWTAFFTHIGETRLGDLALGTSCIVVLLTLRKLKDLKIGVPGEEEAHRVANGFIWFLSTGRNALVVLICSVVALFCQKKGLTPFILTGDIDSGLPKISIPPMSTEVDGRSLGPLEMVAALGSGIVVVPLIAIISNIAISKAFSGGAQVDASQEMIALGLCNLLGSFARSMPVAGAFSRSAVNNASGVRSPLAGLYTSALILLALGLLTPYFFFIPRSSLAAVIMCAVLFMVDTSLLRPLWASNRRDLVPALSTFVACLAVGVEKGLLAGVLVDIVILLYFTARPLVTLHTIQSEGSGSGRTVWVVQPHGCLVFPAMDYVRDRVVAAVRDGRPSALVLDCTHVTRADYTAAQGVAGMVRDARSLGAEVVLMNAPDNVVHSLSGACPELRVASSPRDILTEDATKVEAGICLQNLKKDVL